MIQITYQKRNGNILYRLRKTMLPYRVGDTTSMGWKVLNIEYEYNQKFYTYYEYNKIIHKKKQKYLKRKQLENLCLKAITLLYYIIMIIIILNYIK